MPEHSHPASEKETSRLEAFSDGVFGVAITLLAIEITVDHHTPATDAGLQRALLALWPVYVAYFASFVQILFMWLAHHTIFGLVRRVNTELMLANGLLLLLVVLVPFPTKTLGEFIHTDARHTAAIFYTGYFVLISAAFVLLTRVATAPRYHLLREGVAPATLAQLRRSQDLGLLCNVLIAATAFLNVWLALALSTSMWMYWASLSRKNQLPESALQSPARPGGND
ncbi:TMEM175 family protein [Hymenobacter sp. BRD67]|uniref:TMEM175 family protein n=1 Tax=Hymenobacter sp. BRD67 TaxID=2675877 RepID=UPI001564B41A|nr:TMEM175 family protein [Hymenobacter sp. BRD67]QKG54275.1 DUF1211 domain-containing protein [Hymenobacter sp. BRD67]